MPNFQQAYFEQNDIGYEGRPASHLGEKWNLPNRNNITFNGVGLYRNSQFTYFEDFDLVGYVTFHATRVDAAGGPPAVTLNVPRRRATLTGRGSPSTRSTTAPTSAAPGSRRAPRRYAPGQPLDTSTAGAHTFTVTATDNHGATDTDSHSYNVVDDDQPPTITISQPTEGVVVSQDQTISASYYCSDDGLSGVDACNSAVSQNDPLDTATVGNHVFTVTATDHAGNVTTESRNYTVAPPLASLTYTIDAGGTLTPVDPLSSPPNQISTPIGLTGSYTIQRQAWVQYPGSHLFKVLAFHLQTSTGDTYDLQPGPYHDMYCNDTTPRVAPASTSMRATTRASTPRSRSTTTFHTRSPPKVIPCSPAASTGRRRTRRCRPASGCRRTTGSSR